MAYENGKIDFRNISADRFKKALLEEVIAVLPRSSLPKYIPGAGFHTFQPPNSKQLLEECFAKQRRDAETDFQVIQLVSVFILRYKDEFLTYKRTKRLPENRLHYEYSMFFGGHLTDDDIQRAKMFDIFNLDLGMPILDRELSEEIKITKKSYESLVYRGLLYDDTREVSSQHMGIVFDVRLSSREYSINERGFLMKPKFETLAEIEERINEFENWSVMLLDHEKKVLKGIPQKSMGIETGQKGLKNGKSDSD